MSEKVIFKNSKGMKLVGILETAKTDKIVILAHGFTSNKDRPKIVQTAEAFSKEGYATLRFDFTDSGESDKAGITVAGQLDDLKSTIEFARKKGYTKIGLIGSSLGGLLSVLAYDRDIFTMVLIAPVTAAKTPTMFKDPKMRKEIEEKGYTIIKTGEFRVEKQYLEERESINQAEILSKVKCPVLIIHGDKDIDVPLEHSKNAMKYLPPESKLEIIKGADHDFKDELPQIIPLAVSWIKKHL